MQAVPGLVQVEVVGRFFVAAVRIKEFLDLVRFVAAPDTASARELLRAIG